MKISKYMLALLLGLSLGQPQGVFAQEQVPPDLVYAERYLEKGWYREAWELVDPLIRESDEPTGRLLISGADALYGLDRIGEAMSYVELIHKKMDKAEVKLSLTQEERLKRIEEDVAERFGLLIFEWPPADKGGADLPEVQQFTLEWSGTEAISEADKPAFDRVFQRVGQEGVSDGERIYLPKGRVSINGIWKDITDEPNFFRVGIEKPPAEQRVDSGDGLGFAMGFQGLPGYRGPAYDDLNWDDIDDSAGISSRRYGLVGLPRFEVSASHSLITQGWREIGLKATLGYGAGVGVVGTIPEESVATDLPEAAPFTTFGLMVRQSFHASGKMLFALGIGAQGLYTPRMRFVAQEVSEADNRDCAPSTNMDLFIVDRKTLGGGILASFEASRALSGPAARFGFETTVGYNLAGPVPANKVTVPTAYFEQTDSSGEPEWDITGEQVCFEDEGIVLQGLDLRGQFFFRVALW